MLDTTYESSHQQQASMSLVSLDFSLDLPSIVNIFFTFGGHWKPIYACLWVAAKLADLLALQTSLE